MVGTDTADLEGYQRVTATVPTADITRYAVDLRALTSGRGSFTTTHERYDAVPEHMMASIPRLEGCEFRLARVRPAGSHPPSIGDPRVRRRGPTARRQRRRLVAGLFT
jgi:hypothetical protein